MTPAAGVWCRVCLLEKGHRCQAQVYIECGAAGWSPLCLPCRDGEPCCVDRVGPAPPEDWTPALERDRDIPTPAPITIRTPGQPERKVIAGEIVAMTSGVVMGPEFIQPETRSEMELEQKILEFAGKMTDARAAELCNCTGQRVFQVRRKHDIPAFVPRNDHIRPEPEPPAAQSEEAPLEPQPAMPDQPEPESPVKIEVTITHAMADAVWNSMSLREKAQIVAAALLERWQTL